MKSIEEEEPELDMWMRQRQREEVLALLGSAQFRETLQEGSVHMNKKVGISTHY